MLTQEVAERLGAPPVKEGQVEAIKFVQEVAAEPKLRFDVTLRPGGCWASCCTEKIVLCSRRSSNHPFGIQG
jgi:hypothetical protein